MGIKGLLLSIFFLFSCTAKLEPLHFGKDSCDNCKMGIHDHRYGAQILTHKGKTYNFDAIECMLSFESDKLDKSETVKERFVFNSFHNGALVRLEEAHFLNIDKMRSPMGKGIWASDLESEILKAKAEHDGTLLDWLQLKELLQKK